MTELSNEQKSGDSLSSAKEKLMESNGESIVSEERIFKLRNEIVTLHKENQALNDMLQANGKENSKGRLNEVHVPRQLILDSTLSKEEVLIEDSVAEEWSLGNEEFSSGNFFKCFEHHTNAVHILVKSFEAQKTLTKNLETELRSVEEEREFLRKKCSTLTESLVNIEESDGEYNERLEKSLQEVDALNETVNSLLEEKLSVESELESKSEAVNEMQRKLETEYEKIAKLQKELEKFEKVQEKLNELKDDIDSKQKLIQDQDATMEELVNEKSELEVELEQLKFNHEEDLEEKKLLLERLNNVNEVDADENEALKVELQQMLTQFDSLQQDVLGERQRNQSEKANLESKLQNQSQIDQNILSELESELLVVKSENEALKTTMENLKSTKDEDDEGYLKLEQECQTLMETNQVLESNFITITEKHSSEKQEIENELSFLKSNGNAELEIRQQLEAEIEALKMEKDDLKMLNEELQNVTSSDKTHSDEAQNRIGLLAKENEELKIKMEDTEWQLQTKTEELHAVEQNEALVEQSWKQRLNEAESMSQSNLAKQKKDFQVREVELIDQINFKDLEITRTHREFQSLSDKYTQVLATQDELMETNESLTDEFSIAMAKVNDLKSKMLEKDTKLSEMEHSLHNLNRGKAKRNQKISGLENEVNEILEDIFKLTLVVENAQEIHSNRVQNNEADEKKTAELALSAEVHEYKAKLLKTEAELSDIQNKMQILTTEKAKRNEKIFCLESGVNGIIEDVSKLTSAVDNANEIHCNRVQQNEELDSLLQEVNAISIDKDKLISDLEKQVEKNFERSRSRSRPRSRTSCIGSPRASSSIVGALSPRLHKSLVVPASVPIPCALQSTEDDNEEVKTELRSLLELCDSSLNALSATHFKLAANKKRDLANKSDIEKTLQSALADLAKVERIKVSSSKTDDNSNEIVSETGNLNKVIADLKQANDVFDNDIPDFKGLIEQNKKLRSRVSGLESSIALRKDLFAVTLDRTTSESDEDLTISEYLEESGLSSDDEEGDNEDDQNMASAASMATESKTLSKLEEQVRMERAEGLKQFNLRAKLEKKFDRLQRKYQTLSSNGGNFSPPTTLFVNDQSTTTTANNNNHIMKTPLTMLSPSTPITEMNSLPSSSSEASQKLKLKDEKIEELKELLDQHEVDISVLTKQLSKFYYKEAKRPESSSPNGNTSRFFSVFKRKVAPNVLVVLVAFFTALTSQDFESN